MANKQLHILYKREIHYPDTTFASYGNRQFSGITFIANGTFKGEGFTVIGTNQCFDMWNYRYFSGLRFSSSQMQNLRQTCKNHPPQASLEISAPPIVEMSQLEEMRMRVETEITKPLIRIYPGKAAGEVLGRGAYFNWVEGAYYLLPHADENYFRAYRNEPQISGEIPEFRMERFIYSFKALADENLSLFTGIFPDGEKMLLNISKMSRPFPTKHGLLAYYEYEVIKVYDSK